MHRLMAILWGTLYFIVNDLGVEFFSLLVCVVQALFMLIFLNVIVKGWNREKQSFKPTKE